MRRFAIPLLFGLVLCSAVPVAGQSLRPGSPIQGTLSADDTVRYTLQVEDSTFVFGEVAQISVDVAVAVLNAEGERVGAFDGPGRGAEPFTGRIRNGGTYTIEVTSADEQSGEYVIVLHRVEPIETNPEKLTDQLMARYDRPFSPGAAVRVWRDGRTVFSKAYGMANLAYDIPFAEDTRTNIGSTTKQFTSFAVMLQADRGALSLDDDIRKHIPELPEFDQTITVRHLITHTSGLREFLNLLVMTGRRLDRGDWIDRSELIDIVQHQPALQNEPGAEWNYNNTAYGLAAEIVERTSGKTFPEFMREEVFEPIGMMRTAVRPSPLHIMPDRSEGYTPGPDGFLEIGDLGGAVGAGGIYSTTADLQRWVENMANPRVGSREIFDEMMTSYVLNDGEETGYGYGLSIDEQRGLKRVHHGGADVAHRSMLMYFPEINAGITTQSNHAEFNSGVTADLAAAFFRDAMVDESAVAAAEGDFDPASYDAEDFDAFVGRYSLDVAPNFILTFTREDNTLYTQATGQQRLEITPTSDSTFALSQVEASVVFHREADGSVEGLTLNQNGQNHATRLDDDAEEEAAWEPTADDLEEFHGRYFSDELETFFEISIGDDGLIAKQRRMDELELTAGEADTFATDVGFTFTFERDRNGVVTSFYLSNVRTRDVRFQRVR